MYGPIVWMYASELGSTGIVSIGVFQMLSGGKSAQPPRLLPRGAARARTVSCDTMIAAASAEQRAVHALERLMARSYIRDRSRQQTSNFGAQGRFVLARLSPQSTHYAARGRFCRASRGPSASLATSRSCF